MFRDGEFLIRESTLGADQSDHLARRRRHRVSCERSPAGMRDHDADVGGHLGKQSVERATSCNLHERVAAALLAGLDHPPLESGLGGGGRLCHAAGRLQWHEPRCSQFGELLHHPLLPFSFRQCDGERERDPAGLRIDRRLGSVECHAIAADRCHAGRPLAAGAVEEHDWVAHLRAEHSREVTGLVALELGRAGRRRHGREESFAHWVFGRRIERVDWRFCRKTSS